MLHMYLLAAAKPEVTLVAGINCKRNCNKKIIYIEIENICILKAKKDCGISLGKSGSQLWFNTFNRNLLQQI